MSYLNPHEYIGLRQIVWWNDLEQGVPIEMELVDYFKAPVYQLGRGVYVVYCAFAVSEHPHLRIKAGDILQVFIAYRAFINALTRLPNEEQIPCIKQYADGKNLYIKLEKLNSERIKVYCQSIRLPTEEHLKTAKWMYELIQKEHEQDRCI